MIVLLFLDKAGQRTVACWLDMPSTAEQEHVKHEGKLRVKETREVIYLFLLFIYFFSFFFNILFYYIDIYIFLNLSLYHVCLQCC